MDAYSQDEARDNALGEEFYAIVQQPGAWPTIGDESAAYRRQRDALNAELSADYARFLCALGLKGV